MMYLVLWLISLSLFIGGTLYSVNISEARAHDERLQTYHRQIVNDRAFYMSQIIELEKKLENPIYEVGL